MNNKIYRKIKFISHRQYLTSIKKHIPYKDLMLFYKSEFP